MTQILNTPHPVLKFQKFVEQDLSKTVELESGWQPTAPFFGLGLQFRDENDRVYRQAVYLRKGADAIEIAQALHKLADALVARNFAVEEDVLSGNEANIGDYQGLRTFVQAHIEATSVAVEKEDS